MTDFHFTMFLNKHGLRFDLVFYYDITIYAGFWLTKILGFIAPDSLPHTGKKLQVGIYLFFGGFTQSKASCMNVMPFLSVNPQSIAIRSEVLMDSGMYRKPRS